MADTQRNPTDTSGTLDEALERIHLSGPEAARVAIELNTPTW